MFAVQSWEENMPWIEGFHVNGHLKEKITFFFFFLMVAFICGKILHELVTWILNLKYISLFVEITIKEMKYLQPFFCVKSMASLSFVN